jgi:hypothetical protein
MKPWTETMTARERIEEVALTLREPRSVNWVREQADVGSWETAKSQLEHLVEMGRLTTVDVDGDTRYVTDPMREYLDHIRDLVVEHTKEELRDELEAIAEEVEAWRAEYGVDSPAALDASLGEADLAPEELRERRQVAAYWEENDEYRQRITHALELYDDLTAQDSPVESAGA